MNSSTEKKIGVILQYSQMGLGILVSLIYTPMMLRILGQSEYGIYNFASSIISYLGLLSLGFGSSYIRFYSIHKKENDKKAIARLNGLFLSVFLIMGTIALFSGLILSSNVSVLFNGTYTEENLKIAKILMIFMSINLALSFPDGVFTAYVTAQEKFVFQKTLNMIKTVVGPFLTLPFLLLGYGSIGMVIITTIVTLLVDISNIVFCITKLKMKIDFKNPNIKLLKEIAVFSSFIAINQIVDQINWATDKVVLGKICSSTAVAIYAVGAQINTYYLQFSTAISSVFVPEIHKIIVSDEDEKTKNRNLTIIFTKVGRIQFMILMLVLTGFIFFGKYFIRKWAGEGYTTSYYVALLLIAPATIPLIQNLGIEIQRAKNMHQFRSYVYLIMALLNIIVSICLAKAYGELGAALGTTISLIVANGIIMNIFYFKKMHIDILHFWKEILKFIPALIPAIIIGCVLSLYNCKNILEFVIVIIIYAIVYLISFYLCGLDSNEKKMVNEIIYRIKRKRKNF